jgi:hypothetical protein
MYTGKKIIVGSPINGISINGLEYLLDEHDEVREFVDKNDAVQFLKENGLSAKDMRDFIFEEMEGVKEKMVKNPEPLKKSAPQKKKHDRDDGRGW